MFRVFPVAGLIAGIMIAGHARAAVTASVEAVGVQQTMVALSGAQVATFDAYPDSWAGSGDIFSGAITSSITNGGFRVYNANEYGGAGGSGMFGTVGDTTSLRLSQSVTFTGLWASAIDGAELNSVGNTIALYDGESLLGSFSLKGVLAQASGTIPAGYFGNPNLSFAGRDSGEPFAFFNFTSTTAFNRIDFIQNGGGGFELDNLTIGNVNGAPGGSTPAVPEPASWALMIGGFGMIGAAMRRRHAAIAA